MSQISSQSTQVENLTVELSHLDSDFVSCVLSQLSQFIDFTTKIFNDHSDLILVDNQGSCLNCLKLMILLLSHLTLTQIL